MIALCLLVSVLGAEPTPVPVNPLLTELVTQGVKFPGGEVYKLPAPLMQPGMTAQQQRAQVEKSAGKIPLELFLKQSEAAPFFREVSSVEKSGTRVGQQVTVYAIAFGKLESLRKKEALKNLLGSEGKKSADLKQADALTAEQLKPRGIALLALPGVEEKYAALDLNLLEQVVVRGISRNVQVSDATGIYVASQLDPRFADDKESPNHWRKIDRINEKLLAPQPYAGFASYTSIAQLREPAGALFIEMHVLFHEPTGWFDGNNVLRSKLPIAIDENIRTFRRKLAKE